MPVYTWHTPCFDAVAIFTSGSSPPWPGPGQTSRRPEFQVTETVAAIVAAHRAGHMSPAETIARSYRRIRDYNDSAVFISLRDEKDAIAEAETLSAKDAGELPLLGVPAALKDNIDALGSPTTAAFPASALMALQDVTR